MPLTLVTGPANAAKAGFVLDHLAEANARGREPILVVPTAADLVLFRRELAEREDLVVGPQIMVFDGLLARAAEHAGLTAAPLSAVQRERVVAAAAARGKFGPLAASAVTAGFPAAAASFLGLLSATGSSPQRIARALTDWGNEHGRAPYGADLAALVLAYDGVLTRLGRPDPERYARAVMDALRTTPGLWPGTPVFLYGFDDLTPIELDVVESLATAPVDADVTLSLPAEPGRVAFGGRLGLVADLEVLAVHHEVLAADDAHYTPHARAQLHAIERGLFERDAARAPAGQAVLLLEGGGERAELELVAAHIGRLLRDGVPAGEIAVVARGLTGTASLILDVLADFDIPATARRSATVGETATGRGLTALLRCALAPDATAHDLVAYLRTPGVVRQTDRVDRLEAGLRRDGENALAAARGRWEEAEWPLEAIDTVRDAAADGPLRLLTVIDRRATSLFAGPWRGSASLLDDDGRDEARVLATIRAWVADVLALGALDAGLLPAVGDIGTLLAALTAPLGTQPRRDAVAVLDPLAVRARRVQALFLVDMQEGEFPSLARPDPFLDDDERRELAACTGLVLPTLTDPLTDERHLFYAMVSRPTDLLALSWHAADDDGGAPRNRSPFVDDLADVLSEDVSVQLRVLGQVAWPEGAVAPGTAPARRDAIAAAPDRRAAGPAPLRDPAVLAAVAAQETFSATALETLLDCPMKWFMERWLRGSDLEPAPEPMARGTLYHAVLQDVFAALGAPLTTARLQEARAQLQASLARHAEVIPVSRDANRARASVRRLEVELDRLLTHLAAPSDSRFVPTEFEFAFGGPDDAYPPLVIDEGLSVMGRVDRVDVDSATGSAVVVDYKGTSGVFPQADWIAERRIQAALYVLAARAVLDHQVAGALYQPVRGPKLTARGALRAGVSPGYPVHADDSLEGEAFDRLLNDVLGLVRDAVLHLRRGELEPRPASCGYKGSGCSHPGLCRREGRAP